MKIKLDFFTLFVFEYVEGGQVPTKTHPGSDQVSRVTRKPAFGVFDQVRHKPGCTATEDG